LIEPYVWIPFVEMGGGSDISIRYIYQAIKRAGYDVVLQAFPSNFRIFPHLLKFIKAPKYANIALCESRTGFAFARHGLNVVTVERLFILEENINYKRSYIQRLYHETIVRQFVRNSFDMSDLIVAMSQYTAKSIKRTFPDLEPVVILNGVDTSFFVPPQNDLRSIDNSGPFRLLYVGNLSQRKGAHFLPRIMEDLDESYFLEYTSGKSYNVRLPNKPNMKCLGHLNQDEVRNAYQRAHAVLFPSRLEGMPRVVMEAMACGTPVIGSNASSIPELITNEVDGILCNPENYESFVSATIWLKNNIKFWNSISKKAREKIVTFHNLNDMTQNYIDLFYKLLNEI